MDVKATVWHYLKNAREQVLWKVEGLPERDQRMPLTPTGTNLLGVVKHLAGVEAEYFGVPGSTVAGADGVLGRRRAAQRRHVGHR